MKYTARLMLFKSTLSTKIPSFFLVVTISNKKKVLPIVNVHRKYYLTQNSFPSKIETRLPIVYSNGSQIFFCTFCEESKNDLNMIDTRRS